MNPSRLETLFILGQAAIGALILFVLIRAFNRQSSESAFKTREADRTDRPSAGKSGEALAEARMKRPSAPLALEGIRLDAPAHELLGVPLQATESEIQRAYRELMKRYHPDRVGRPGTREWQDAQRIAEKINAAKDELLSRAKKRG